MNTIKEQLMSICQQQVDDKILSLKKTLNSITESRNNETKSSVGDKYETGRSMMQMEEERINRQLAEVYLMQKDLQQISFSEKSEVVKMGSLVTTSNGQYFLSVGLGKIKIGGQNYYCISNKSPIGQLLLGKTEGESFQFNNRNMTIEKVF
ncbi:MAG: GreA/GreB family elongation factor [Bacteroidota bacterium]